MRRTRSRIQRLPLQAISIQNSGQHKVSWEESALVLDRSRNEWNRKLHLTCDIPNYCSVSLVVRRSFRVFAGHSLLSLGAWPLFQWKWIVLSLWLTSVSLKLKVVSGMWKWNGRSGFNWSPSCSIPRPPPPPPQQIMWSAPDEVSLNRGLYPPVRSIKSGDIMRSWPKKKICLCT